MGRGVEPALREALDGKPSIALREKAQLLLDRFEGHRPPPETLRQRRALEAIERAGGPAAFRAATDLTRSRDTHLAEAARAALARLTAVK
jgi:hypothetical protein